MLTPNRVQDDLALMIEGLPRVWDPSSTQLILNTGTDGYYYFQAGSICLPGG